MPLPVELFRFRVVRNVQAQKLLPSKAIDLSTSEGFPASPTQASQKIGAVIDPSTWDHWLASVSTTLALQGDLLEPKAVVKLLPADWQTQVGNAAWTTLRKNLAISLAHTMADLAPAAADYRILCAKIEALARGLRLHDLVTTINADMGRAESAHALKSARNVQAAASRKAVVLPSAYFRARTGKANLVRNPGVTDFYVVKDEWNRYQAGELARVINVLPGETFDTRLKHFEKTESASSTTTQSTTSQETDNSQTTSSSLSQASTKDSSLNIGVNAQVQVSAQYGPAHIDATAGGSLQSSQSDSESRAFTTSLETVQRSVKEVSKSVIQVQSTRTLVGEVTTEDHKLANTNTNTTVGLYRWLSEVHRVQLMRYPNRFVLEFEIPEPGAWLRWAMQTAPKTTFNPDPGAFRLQGAAHDLSPMDIAPNAVAELASRWRIQGLQPAPPAQMTVSVKLTVDPVTQNEARFAIASDDTMTVPDGYVADKWNAEIRSSRTWSLKSYGTQMTVTVGGGASAQGDTGDLGLAAGVSGGLSGNCGPINTGLIPVAVYTIALQGFTCVVNVTCNRMNETYLQWQQTTFDQIVGAYQSLKQAYQQELTDASQQPGSIADLIGPPELNKTRAGAELRRLVIQDLMGTPFSGEPAIAFAASTNEPSVQLDNAQTVAPTIQFFEQAFEWENLVYICYPYYWARHAQWPASALAATADPEFDQFLNSGSARVTVPARPGFEDLVNYFLYTGEVWQGKRPPAPNDPDYISIAQEIQDMQTGATDGTPVGSSWEISLPTTLLWAGSDETTLPTNPNPKIPAPTP